MTIDGVKVTIDHASGCRCEPDEDDARGVLEAQAKVFCLHCRKIVEPEELRMMCFCVAGGTGSEQATNWAGNIQEYKGVMALSIDNRRCLLHEVCAMKILPGWYS